MLSPVCQKACRPGALVYLGGLALLQREGVAQIETHPFLN